MRASAAESEAAAEDEERSISEYIASPDFDAPAHWAIPSEFSQREHPLVLSGALPARCPAIPDAFGLPDPRAMSAEERAEAIRAQLEFYLSPPNLRRDWFFRNHMRTDDASAAIPLAVFLTCYNLARLAASPADLVRAALATPSITVLTTVAGSDNDDDDDNARDEARALTPVARESDIATLLAQADGAVDEIWLAPTGGEASLREDEEMRQARQARSVVLRGVHPWVPTHALMALFARFGPTRIVWRPTDVARFRREVAVAEFESEALAKACVEQFAQRTTAEERMGSADAVMWEQWVAPMPARKALLRVAPLAKAAPPGLVTASLAACGAPLGFIRVEVAQRTAMVSAPTPESAEALRKHVASIAAAISESSGAADRESAHETDGESGGDELASAQAESARIAPTGGLADAFCANTVVQQLTRAGARRYFNSFGRLPVSESEEDEESGVEGERTRGRRRQFYRRGCVVKVSGLRLPRDLQSGVALMDVFRTRFNGVVFVSYRRGEDSCLVRFLGSQQADAAASVLDGAGLGLLDALERESSARTARAADSNVTDDEDSTSVARDDGDEATSAADDDGATSAAESSAMSVAAFDERVFADDDLDSSTSLRAHVIDGKEEAEYWQQQAAVQSARARSR